MPPYEEIYASLAKSLLDGIAKSAEPSSERALDILSMLQRESSKESQPITTSILENTKIGRALRKALKVCKRRGQTRATTSDGANDEWHKASAIAEELLSKFKAAHEAEKVRSEQMKYAEDAASEMVIDAIADISKANADGAVCEVEVAQKGDKCNASKIGIDDTASKMVVNAIADISKANPCKAVAVGEVEVAQRGDNDNTLEIGMVDPKAGVIKSIPKFDEEGESQDMDTSLYCRPTETEKSGDSSDHPTLVSYSEETLPQQLYGNAQRVYAKDDATGVLYPAFIRKVMWGPKCTHVDMGFCSSLAEGGDIMEKNNAQMAAEYDDEEEDEDSRRWGPRRNCWHYFVHYMGWAAKWDRWIEESFLYDDSASTQTLAKTIMTEYKKVKPKKKGQKMTPSQVAKWMKRMTQLEAEHRRLEKEGKSLEGDGNKCDGRIKDERKVADINMSESGDSTGKVGESNEEILQDHFTSIERSNPPVKQEDDVKDTKQNENDSTKASATIEYSATKKKRKKAKRAKRIAEEAIQKQAQLRDSGLQMQRKKSLSFQLTLPFNLKKVLVEEWEVITKCEMVHNLPAKISVREALNRYLESKLAPLREKHEKESKKKAKTEGGDDEMESNGEPKLGKEWIEMIEGIALFFDQALPVHLLFAEERSQYASFRRQILAQRRNAAAASSSLEDVPIVVLKAEKSDGGAKQPPSTPITDTITAVSEASSAQSIGSKKAPPANLLPERMSEIYGCEHLLRLFVRLPAVVAEAPALSDIQSRRIFSKVGDLMRYTQKNQSTLFQPSFRRLLPGEIRRAKKASPGK